MPQATKSPGGTLYTTKYCDSTSNIIYLVFVLRTSLFRDLEVRDYMS